MATITVLGAGMMGSALCVPLVDRGHSVRLVGTHLDGDIIENLRRSRTHPKLGQLLPPTITPYPIEQLHDAMEGTDVIGVGVSSAGVGWAGEQLAPYVAAERPIVMISKGLHWDGEQLQMLPDLLARQLQRYAGESAARDVAPAAVGGPCIAGELARRVETCVVVASRSEVHAQRLANLMGAPYYHVWASSDVVGVEVCAALKNAYAMGIAFAMGLHERAGGQPGSVAMHNYEAAVFAQAVGEMQQIVERLGGDPRTANGLAGVGDLNVTTNGGRTGRFGRLLGLGSSVAEAVQQMQGATLECLEILQVLHSARNVLADLRSSNQLPLLEHLTAVALQQEPVAVPFEQFFQHRAKP